MLAEIKLEAIEWYYMEMDYAVKHNLQVSHEIVFEKTLDTAMRDLTDFEYMVWCFEILSRFERQMIPMSQNHIEEIKKAINIYNSIDYKSIELSDDEIIRLKKDYTMAVDYIEWSLHRK